MAYDAGRGVVVLFGGYRTGGFYQTDIWEYDGTTWTEIPGRDGTWPPSGGGVLAYDSARHLLVFCQGGAGTREYDGSTWSEVATTVRPPSCGGMAYDSARRVMVLVSNATAYLPPVHTWEYDGVEWAEVETPTAPSTRDSFGMAFDSDRGVVLIFGGTDWTGAVLADTWNSDGTTWTEVEPTVSPSARRVGGMAYDSVRNVTVLFGGSGSDGVLGDTWEYYGP